MRIIPYTYGFDGSGLSDGANYTRRQVAMREDGIFRLRKLAGLHLLAQSVRIYHPSAKDNPQSSYASRSGSALMLVPELSFERQQSIIFDLNEVSRAVIVCGLTPIYPSQLCFQGVRSLPDTALARPKGIERPYTWTYPLTLDWYHYASGSDIAAPRYRQFKIDTYDFECHRLRISNADGTALTGNDFALQFYDVEQYALSNQPIVASSLNNAADPQVVWPSVPVLYPKGSILRFAVQSFLCSAVPLPVSYQLAFEGKIWT